MASSLASLRCCSCASAAALWALASAFYLRLVGLLLLGLVLPAQTLIARQAAARKRERQGNYCCAPHQSWLKQVQYLVGGEDSHSPLFLFAARYREI